MGFFFTLSSTIRVSDDESILFEAGVGLLFYHYYYLQRPTQGGRPYTHGASDFFIFFLVYDWAWVGKESGLTRKLKKRRPSGLGRTAAFLGYGNTSFGKRFFRYLPYVKGFLLGSKLITWCLATSLDLAPFSVTPSSISSQDVAGKVTKDKPGQGNGRSEFEHLGHESYSSCNRFVT